jgi:hypothetical protein
MSIVFKPRISFSFGSGRSSIVKNKPVRREELEWSETDTEKMVVLRAFRCTYRECGKHFNRSAESCSSLVQKRGLGPAIIAKRDELLIKVTQ